MHFTCSVSPAGLRVQISPHEGTFTPWWKEIRLEIHGWIPGREVQEDGRPSSATVIREANAFAITVADTGKGVTLDFK